MNEETKKAQEAFPFADALAEHLGAPLAAWINDHPDEGLRFLVNTGDRRGVAILIAAGRATADPWKLHAMQDLTKMTAGERGIGDAAIHWMLTGLYPEDGGKDEGPKE